MDGIICFVAAVFLTSVTGTMLFGIWYAIGKILEKNGFINIMSDLLKVVMLFWFYPLVFLILILENFSHWGGVLFHYTPVLHRFCTGLFVIWVIGAICMIVRYIESNRILAARYHSLVPVDGSDWEYFNEICVEMGVEEGSVELVQDYKANVPYLCGLKKQYVVLPVRVYTKDQLRVIFVHELTHYSQGAQMMRHLAAIAKAVHFFNPTIYLFDSILDFWNEYACDYAAIPKIGSMQTYFNEIMKTIQQSDVDVFEEISTRESLDTRLMRRKSQLLKRVEMMEKSCHRQNRSTQAVSFLAIFIMLLVSGVLIHGITRWVGNQYVEIYVQTVEQDSLEEN